MINYKIYANNKNINKIKKDIIDTSKYIKNKKLDVSYLTNGIIVPVSDLWGKNPFGGVVDENGEINKLSLRNYILLDNKLYANANYCGINPNIDLNKIKFIDDEIIFLGLGFSQRDYGHTIYESLSRLWYLLDKDIKTLKVAFISPPSKDCIDLLNLFGIEEKNIITVLEPTKYKKVIVPENAIELAFVFNIKYKEVINRIKYNVQESNFEKVYFSRSKLFYKRTLYEEKLESVFRDNGYKIFYPEELSVYDKISIVKGCKYFAGIEASNEVHQVFANDGINVIILIRNYYSKSIYPISYFINANLILLSANNTSFPTAGGSGPFLIGCNEETFKFFDDFNFKYNKNNFYYKPYQIIDYLFVWAKTYKLGVIKNLAIQKLSNEEIADNIIDIHINRIEKNDTLPVNILFFIGITTEIGSINIKPYFEIIIFGKKILKLSLNKYYILRKVLKIIPTTKLKNKFIAKFKLNSDAANDDSDSYFIRMYNDYNKNK